MRRLLWAAALSLGTLLPAFGQASNPFAPGVPRSQGPDTTGNAGYPISTVPAPGSTAWPVSGSVTATAAASVLSANNATTTPILADASFTGTGEDVLGYQSVTVYAYSDRTFDLHLQFSSDNVHWDDDQVYTNDGYQSLNPVQSPCQGRYFRIVLSDTSHLNETLLRVQSILNRGPAAPQQNTLLNGGSAAHSLFAVGNYEISSLAAWNMAAGGTLWNLSTPDAPASDNVDISNRIPLETFASLLGYTDASHYIKLRATAGGLLKVDGSGATLTVSQDLVSGRAVVCKTGSLTSTAATADQVVLTYTVTAGKTFYLSYIEFSADYTTLSVTGGILGAASVETPSGTKIFTETLVNPTTEARDRVQMTFSEPIPIAAAAVVRVVCTPTDTTSTLWRANLGGYER